MKVETMKRLCWILVVLFVVTGPMAWLSGCGESTPAPDPNDPAAADASAGDPAVDGDEVLVDPATKGMGGDAPPP